MRRTRLARQMHAYRVACKATQSEWARVCGVESSTVSRWERGVSKPRPRLVAHCDYLYDAKWRPEVPQ